MFLTRPKMQKVGAWYLNGALEDAFHFGTVSPIDLDHSDSWRIFDSIFAPIRIPTEEGMPDEWSFVDVGFTPEQLADCYAAQYSGNFWPEYFETRAEFRDAEAAGRSIVIKKIRACVRMNWQKYMQLIELGGYTFNPLYNVDGEELYSVAELHGKEKRVSQFDDNSTHTVSTYDEADKEEATDRSYTAGDGDTVTTEHIGTGQAVDAASDAFGAGMSDSDLYHADKRIRRGNIGLTKSTELRAAFRDDIRASIIQTFFDDLNEILLIPIY